MTVSPAYRYMRPGEETEVCDLIIRVFKEFVAPEFPQRGVQEFLDYVKPDSLLKRSQANYFVLVATAQDRVVGMIEVRDNNHISLLFVDKPFLRRKIGKQLLRRALEICLSRQPDTSEVSVNSSPYAVHIYEKLGFRPKGPKQIVNGVCFVPMALELPNARGI